MIAARGSALGLLLSIALGGCSPGPGAHADGSIPDPTCSGRGESVTIGLRKVSAGGYQFVLAALEPAVPVQSAGAPGNTWTLSVSDPEGRPISGAALLVTSYMPDHAHAGPPAVGVERGEGMYEVDDLVLAMPALYAITSTLTLPSGAQESVVVSLCLSPS